ncbi:hypothetical protein NPIL_8711 [Nephila pilipes]|uniref:Uncharacterized protein n=1 Tax=Nephila pilipes TaxID=299642 RepID=A0A8X6Q8G2_NEPPI|nr:hypothetical protein NPIL_8711 [Nephila pilipes]
MTETNFCGLFLDNPSMVYEKETVHKCQFVVEELTADQCGTNPPSYSVPNETLGPIVEHAHILMHYRSRPPEFRDNIQMPFHLR